MLSTMHPELDTALQVESHENREVGDNHLPQPARDADFDAAEDMSVFLCCKYTLTAGVELLINQTSFSLQLLLIQLPSSLHPFLGLPQPRCMTFHLAMLNFMRFSQSYLSKLRSLWMSFFPSRVSLSLHLSPISHFLLFFLTSFAPLCFVFILLSFSLTF